MGSDLGVAAQLSFGQLAKRSRDLASWLRMQGAAGEPVVVVLPNGLEFVTAFFACLEAAAMVVPAVPPRTQAEVQRLAGIVDDCAPRLVLTNVDGLERTAAVLGDRAVTCAAIERIPPVAEPAVFAPAVGTPSGDRPALIQYTSGSTSAPRGAVVSHGNLLANEEMIVRRFGVTERDVVLSWLPIHHDMGLVGGLLAALYVGGRAVLLSPGAFLRRPARWLEAIGRFGASVSGAPNFAYELCSRRVSQPEAARLDLCHWRVAFCGAEPVRAPTLAAFADRFAPAGFDPAAFFPCYGLAEATLMVTAGGGPRPVIASFDAAALETGRAVPHERGVAMVGCGAVAPGLVARIVDPHTCRPRPAEEIGEIWVAGPSVCVGYRNDPPESARTFGATLADGDGRHYLRTGDLGFFYRGNLFVTGRLKSTIVVHGRNHSAADLEWTAARSHGSLRPSGTAALAIDDGTAERVVIVQEVERAFRGDWDVVARAVRTAVAEAHDIRIHEVVLTHDRLPLTTSHKVQRFAVRQALADGSLGVVHRSVSAPTYASALLEVERGELRSKAAAAPPSERARVIGDFVRAQIAGLLGPDAARDLDPARPLFELGLDSLTGVQLRDAVGRAALLDLPATFALEHPTLESVVRELAAAMDAADRLASAPAPGSDLAALLDEIEGLEDAQVFARLYGYERSS